MNTATLKTTPRGKKWTYGLIALAALGLLSYLLQEGETPPEFPAYPGYDPKEDCPQGGCYKISRIITSTRDLWEHSTPTIREACQEKAEAFAATSHPTMIVRIFYSYLEDCLRRPTAVTVAEHAGHAENAKRIQQVLDSSPEQLRQLIQKEKQDEVERGKQHEKAIEETVCATEHVQNVQQQAEALAKEQFASDGSGLTWEQLSPVHKRSWVVSVNAWRLWCHPASPTEPPRFPLFENYKPDDVGQENILAAQAAWQHATAIAQSICVKAARLHAEDPMFAEGGPNYFDAGMFYASLNVCLVDH